MNETESNDGWKKKTSYSYATVVLRRSDSFWSLFRKRDREGHFMRPKDATSPDTVISFFCLQPKTQESYHHGGCHSCSFSYD